MAQLIVRDLDETIVQALRERAARAGVSIEEEHRRILRQALRGPREPRDFKEHLLSIPAGAGDEAIRRERPANRGRAELCAAFLRIRISCTNGGQRAAIESSQQTPNLTLAKIDRTH